MGMFSSKHLRERHGLQACLLVTFFTSSPSDLKYLLATDDFLIIYFKAFMQCFIQNNKTSNAQKTTGIIIAFK